MVSFRICAALSPSSGESADLGLGELLSGKLEHTLLGYPFGILPGKRGSRKKGGSCVSGEPDGGAALDSKEEGEKPGNSEPDAFHIRTQLILSHFLRNRVQTSFRLNPLP